MSYSYERRGLLWLAALFFWPSSASADSCSKQRAAYGNVSRYAASALDGSVDVADVTASVGTLQDAARALNACLPPLPQTRPTRSGYLVDHGIGSIQECEAPLDAMVANPFLDCLAAWDGVARDKYRVPLPTQECSSLVPEFVRARDALRACHAKYRFAESTRLKLPLSVTPLKTHSKSEKRGAICFGAQLTKAEPDANVFVSIDDGMRTRFSGATGTLGFDALALAEPHTVHVFSGLKEIAAVPLDFKGLKTNFVTLSKTETWQVAPVGRTTCK